MQIIDVFSGIGGFSYAGRMMGWRTVQFCEIDKFCQRVLSYHYPGVPIHDNIKTLTAKQIKENPLYNENETTIFVGGVPCQPWSVAGKRLGKADDRDLWKETTDLIGELKPHWCVLENVRGLVNWSGGLVFDQVQADLEAEGYEVLPFILPACAVNAPHRRDRVWFVAYSDNSRARERVRTNGERETENEGRKGQSQFELRQISETTENPVGSGLLHGEHEQEGAEDGQQWELSAGDSDRVCISEGVTSDTLRGRHGRGTKEAGSDSEQERAMGEDFGQYGDGVRSETQRCGEVTSDAQSERSERTELGGEPQTCQPKQREFGGSDSEGVTTNANGFGWRGESDRVGESGQFNKTSEGSHWENFPTQSPVCDGDDGLSARLDGITFSKWRQESIKAGGNAVVPQVVFQIFKAIQSYQP
jgi:DNA (cytosine-5)-methyltransferase 1